MVDCSHVLVRVVETWSEVCQNNPSEHFSVETDITSHQEKRGEHLSLCSLLRNSYQLYYTPDNEGTALVYAVLVFSTPRKICFARV